MMPRYRVAALATGVVLALTGAAQANVLTGSYTGNGAATQQITFSAPAFKPDVVIIKDSGTTGDMVIRTTTMGTGDATKDVVAAAALFTNGIKSLDSTGFTVGNNAGVNFSAHTYYWVAFKAAPGELVVGSYTGGGNGNITGVGFQPNVVYVLSAGANLAVFRTSTMIGDYAIQFNATAGVANLIQSMQTDGFQVGSDTRVNALGTIYHYVAWKSVTGKMGVGTYSGTGSAKTTTPLGLSGATPAWVTVKRENTSAMVSKPSSLAGTTSLLATATASITTGITALGSDSFTVGTDISVNKSGQTYDWAAFARPSCTAPGEVDYLAATATSTSVTVQWSSSNPALVLRKTLSAVADIPLDGFYYAQGETLGSSTVAYTGAATEISITDRNLSANTPYYYKVFAKDSKGCYSAGTPFSITTPAASGAPAWTYAKVLPAGSTFNPGISGTGTLYWSSNAARMMSLDTTTGLPNWRPIATATGAAVQGWLTWLPVDGGNTTTGLVGYWKLDETSLTSAADSSGNSFTGTVNGTPSWTSGRIGGALSFDGSTNYVNVPHNAALNGSSSTALTVSAWFKTNTSSAGPGIVCKYTGVSPYGWFLKLEPIGGLHGYYANSGGNGAQASTTTVLGNDDTWHHGVMVVLPTGITVYQDGVNVASGAWSGAAGAATTTQDLHIGHCTGTQYFTGRIDDVRVYNGALTAAQVADLYNSTVAHYAYHQNIAVTTGAAAPPSGYSVPLSFNHASLVAAGKARADGSDLRVYYLTSDNRLAELDRVLDTDSSVGAWNQANTKIWFKTQAAIPANSIDDSYFLYYGDTNPVASATLANPSNVYLHFDDFESGTLSKWQGDTTYFASTTARAHAGTRSVQAGPETNLQRSLLANPALNVANVYVEAWWNVSDTTSNDIQNVVRVVTPTGAFYRYETTLKPNPTPGWNIAKDLNGTRTELSAPLGAVTANTWTRIGLGVYATSARMFKDGAQLNPASGSVDVGTDLPSGSVGLNKFSLTGTWWIDDVVVRRYVDPEPTAALAGLEEGGTWGMVVGGDQAARVYSIDSGSGLQNWTLDLSTQANAIQATTAAQLSAYSTASLPGGADLIFATSYNSGATNCPSPNNTATKSNKIFAIRSTDGAVQWTHNWNGTTCPYAMDYAGAMPVVDYALNRLYVTTGDGGAGQQSLWVINTLTGALVTPCTACTGLGNLGNVAPTLSYDGTTLYVTNSAGVLYAINTTTLALKWASGFTLGSPASAIQGFMWQDYSGALKFYFATADGNLWSVQDNGTAAQQLWKTSVGASGSPILLDVLYVGSTDGKVHKVSLAGVAGSTYPSTGTLDGANTIGNISTETASELFVGTNGGKIFRLPLSLLP